MFHISQVKPVVNRDFCPPAKPPHAVGWSMTILPFQSNRLVDVPRRGRGLQYLVDWEDYGPEEQSWVSHSLILDPDLI